MAQKNNTASAASATKAPNRNLQVWLPRALMLGVIWGIAVFLWGTFGAWTNTQYEDGERRLATRQAAGITQWLNQAVEPLDRLANDKRLVAGMELPAGVESLPIQRVLYEYAYLTGQTEVYIVDLMRKRVGRTAGASPLPTDAAGRLADMDDAPHLLLGIGQRSGQMLLAKRVPAPLPNRLVVIVPVSLATLATGQPTYALPPQRELALVVPHTVGWALWRKGGQGFQFNDTLQSAMKNKTRSFAEGKVMTVLVPLAGWPQVAISMESPNAISGTRLLPQLLVGLWAIFMSALVLWSAGAKYRAKALAAAAPVLGPLGNVAGVIGGPVSTALHKLSDAVGSYWKEATHEAPLVDGPGAFAQDDFSTVDELARKANGGARRAKPSKPLKLPQAVAPVTPKGAKVKRAPMPHGGKEQVMKWPGLDQPKLEPKPKAAIIPEPDKDDIRAIVEDCLRKRRVRLLYQPIFRTGDNMPVMHEVYARLVRGDGQIITPDVFLPVALKYKMALELDLVVLRKVIHEHFSGNSAPMTPLALNISSTSLDGIAYLQEMTNQGPRVLQKISFEVRSQEMIRDPKALRLLKDLQKHGGNLAVDYFGGGTAMLEASKAMGFNYVKLNCLKLIGTDAGKKEIISLCQHAKGIGLPVILEMVSDREAMEFGRKAGAEFLQGYALARPQETLATQPLTPDLDGVKNLAQSAQ